MEKDILRLTSHPGMPKSLHEVQQWQLTALQQKLTLV